MGIIKRAIGKVYEHLTEDINYDVQEWRVNPKASNQNVIHGVKKVLKGIKTDVTLVIRPTDGDKLIFYEDFERKSLLQPNSELWGNNDYDCTQEITIGKMLIWNSITKFKVNNSQ